MSDRLLMRETILSITLALVSTLGWAETVNYTHDAAGRLTTVTSDSGHTIQYVYDKAGNLVERVVSGLVPSTDHDEDETKGVEANAEPNEPERHDGERNGRGRDEGP